MEERYRTQENQFRKDYVQFSKKLAKWSVISLMCVVLCAYGIISFVEIMPEEAESIVRIAQAGTVAISLIVASYMGNSGVEKMANAKYNINKVLNREDDEGDGAG